MCRGIQCRQSYANRRRGSITVLAAFLLALFLGMLAFAIDLGYMCVVRTQAQAAADSAAMAAAWEMISDEPLSDEFYDVTPDARRVAGQYAGYHRVGPQNVQLVTTEDVQFGRLNDVSNTASEMLSDDSTNYNAVSVTIRSTAARGSGARHFFARFFGHDSFDMVATATAVFGDRVSGFRATKRCPNTTLLPFALNIDDWTSLTCGNDDDEGAGDHWTFYPGIDAVGRGSDGIPEINLYPISTGAGNWGTVDIGNANNSTKDLERQIRWGVNSTDLEAHGGALQLDRHTKSLTLNGDTGISAGMKDALDDILGNPRTIPLYSSASGNGNNMNYEIVGFAGIRIVQVRLTGQDKIVRIQPAVVVDGTAVTSSWATKSNHVIQRVHLIK